MHTEHSQIVLCNTFFDRYLQPFFFFFVWGSAIDDFKGTAVPTNQKLSVAFEGPLQNWACLWGTACRALRMMAFHVSTAQLTETHKLGLSNHLFIVEQKSYNFLTWLILNLDTLKTASFNKLEFWCITGCNHCGGTNVLVMKALRKIWLKYQYVICDCIICSVKENVL